MSTAEHPRGAAFATTRWSLVASAGSASGPEARRALEELCSTYWYPAYAYLRRRGEPLEDARDLVQSFFARLVERGDLARADARRGRFRAFLLACLRNFRANERDRARAQVRGGGARALSLDELDPEARWAIEAPRRDDPERSFERAWALGLLERTVARVRGEWEARGQAALFERLRPVLAGEDLGPYGALASELGTSEGGLRVAVHRLRRRYAELLRAEIADTVASPADVEAELRSLLEVLAG